MKSQITRMFSFVAVALFSVVACALPASAHEAVKGHFTLPYQVRWQGASLPAGDYTFSLESLAGQSPMTLRGPNGAMFQLGHISAGQPSEKASVLILEWRDGAYFVREMDLSNLGVQIRYDVPKQARSDKQLAHAPAAERILVAMVTE